MRQRISRSMLPRNTQFPRSKSFRRRLKRLSFILQCYHLIPELSSNRNGKKVKLTSDGVLIAGQAARFLIGDGALGASGWKSFFFPRFIFYSCSPN